MFSHFNSGYANAPQCHVTHTLPLSWLFPAIYAEVFRVISFLKFVAENPVCISLLPATPRPHPSLPPWFHHQNNILREAQIMQLFVTQFSWLPTSYARTSPSTSSCRTPPGYVSPSVLKIQYQTHTKAIPLQAWTGPEGSRTLILSDFKTISAWRW